MPSFNSRGHEVLDQTPLEMPMQWHRPPTLEEQIKSFVRRELSMRADQAGQETFQEADDFDIDDDPIDPSSPWELHFDQEHYTPEEAPSPPPPVQYPLPPAKVQAYADNNGVPPTPEPPKATP